ncbi:hypothetical protein V5N11_026800 [Cardamine amara subsp. amara]|uniref:Transposase MuDR plant domain-containing protein n=1 Tax=Cardamine amara subsp. amara TaxID=228776 RepID=A0ABD1BYJ2_CARAN
MLISERCVLAMDSKELDVYIEEDAGSGVQDAGFGVRKNGFSIEDAEIHIQVASTGVEKDSSENYESVDLIRGGNGEDKLARWFLENSSDKHTHVEGVEDNGNWSCDDQINDDEVLPNTPIQSSDDEEDCVENLFKRKSNFKQWELHLGQIFNDVQAFKDALVIYVLNEQRNIKLCRWEKEKHEAICCGEGCRWRIYCSLERPLNKWQVKVYNDIHTCINTGHCKMIKIPIIARL